MVHIRSVELEDAKAFWALRLEALKSNPEAFGASYEDAVQLSESEIQQRIAGSLIVGAFNDQDQLVGMVGFKREQGMKLRHKGMIWGVYVSLDYRGQGLATALFKELFDRISGLEGLQQVNLAVVTTNAAAIRLYRNFGFVTYGIEKNALMYEGQGYDEELMTYFF
ncbi:GNAT family N-acetyltransferase [Paenibacillus tuaregi]|uniref:GNAT family N-acetyltransferase n=1 Tax=Paenibacillus tuaregi TaxID=1816681 RepID=UPI0008386BCA|nr:GNAT family N-acetyltransferase [Paenibacillus tuaregi]